METMKRRSTNTSESPKLYSVRPDTTNPVSDATEPRMIHRVVSSLTDHHRLWRALLYALVEYV